MAAILPGDAIARVVAALLLGATFTLGAAGEAVDETAPVPVVEFVQRGGLAGTYSSWSVGRRADGRYVIVQGPIGFRAVGRYDFAQGRAALSPQAPNLVDEDRERLEDLIARIRASDPPRATGALVCDGVHCELRLHGDAVPDLALAWDDGDEVPAALCELHRFSWGAISHAHSARNRLQAKEIAVLERWWHARGVRDRWYVTSDRVIRSEHYQGFGGRERHVDLDAPAAIAAVRAAIAARAGRPLPTGRSEQGADPPCWILEVVRADGSVDNQQWWMQAAPEADVQAVFDAITAVDGAGIDESRWSYEPTP